MATRTAFVKLGYGASIVGAVMIVLYVILKATEASIGGLENLLVAGLALGIGGLCGGLWVSRTDPSSYPT